MRSIKSSSTFFINYLLLTGIALIWGSQYFFNKIALESFSTWMITAGRVLIGSLVLTLLFVAKGKEEKKSSSARSFWHHLPDFIMIGFFEATLPCLLIAWAQKQVPSSVTAILIGTVPLFATLLEAQFVKEHTISQKKVLAIIIGFLGVLTLVGPGLFQGNSDAFQSLTLSLPLVPVLALLTASLSFAISVSLIKIRLSTKLPPLRSAQGILIGAVMTALPLLFWMSGRDTFLSAHPSASSLVALALLGIFGGGIVYTLYVRLIERAGPSFASSANYLALPIGAFIGIGLAGEKMTINVIASLLLILTALWLSRGKRK